MFYTVNTRASFFCSEHEREVGGWVTAVGVDEKKLVGADECAGDSSAQI